jgi:AcrR family transcriptional regulator
MLLIHRMDAAAPNLRVPVQTRSHRTRAAIVKAACREFAERGYAETTARSIAAKARVGTGTFYHYFPDKDAVLREIAQERVDALLAESLPLTASPVPRHTVEALVADARARLGRLVELYVEYHRHDRGLHAVITERRNADPGLAAIMDESEREAVKRTTLSLSRWAPPSGDFPGSYDGDAEAAAVMMFSLLEGAVHGHVLGQAMISDERFAQALTEALFRIALPPRWFLLPPHVETETSP